MGSKGLWLLLFIVELEALSGFCFFSCFASGFFFFFLLGFRLLKVYLAGVDEQVVPQQHFLDVAGVYVLGVVVGEHFLEVGEQVGAGGFLYLKGDGFALFLAEDVLQYLAKGFFLLGGEDAYLVQ